MRYSNDVFSHLSPSERATAIEQIKMFQHVATTFIRENRHQLPPQILRNQRLFHAMATLVAAHTFYFSEDYLKEREEGEFQALLGHLVLFCRDFADSADYQRSLLTSELSDLSSGFLRALREVPVEAQERLCSQQKASQIKNDASTPFGLRV